MAVLWRRRIRLRVEKNGLGGFARLVDHVFGVFGTSIVPVVAIKPFAMDHVLNGPVFHFNIRTMAKPTIETQFWLDQFHHS